MQTDYRYFKNVERDSFMAIPVEKIQDYSYIGGFYYKEDDEFHQIESEIYDHECGKSFSETSSVSWFEQDIYDSEENKIDPEDLGREIEGFTYYDGHNWKLIALTDDFNETGYEEVTEEMPEIDFDNAIDSCEGAPGLYYKLYQSEDGSDFIEQTSAWQGSLPFGEIYKIDSDEIDKTSLASLWSSVDQLSY